MIARALAGFAVLIGLGAGAPADAPVRHMNPNDILFSMSTISNDAAPLEAFSGKIGGQDLIFHEDEWRQIEFFPKKRLGEVERLKEIDRLPFERKLAHLESFLEEARDKYLVQT